MELSRHEINLRRLLAKCELMCKNQKDDERFEKYVATLEDMIQDVKKSSNTSIESVKDYQKRIMNIKTTLGITTLSKYEEFNDPVAMREDLLGLRQRRSEKPNPESEDLDQVLKYQEKLQDKIAADVLLFTQTLKEQSLVANRIIKKDTEVLTNATDLSDRNVSKLVVEQSKLAEHTKSACRCWMWSILAIVLMVFVVMVLFMKVAKKN